METKYLLTILIVGTILIFSFIAAKGSKEEQLPTNPVTSFYDLKAKSIYGEEISMSDYKGKKILIVNVASKCGYTYQYAGLEKLFREYSDKFVVLGFPSNDFLRQEPGSNKDIAKFCSTNYSISFPMFEKIKVKGSDMHDIYNWLSDPNKNGWNDQSPSWNFSKYLIDENGKLIKRFSSKVNPQSKEIVNLIK